MTSLLNQSEILTSPVTNTPEISERRATRRSDHELQLVRRIDWRFLLPEPYLRRVAYLGSERGALPVALKHFSDSFRIVSAVDDKTAFDLVVLRLSERSELAKARALLVSGGFLYWEMKPLKWSDSWRGLIKRSPRPLWGAVEATECGLAVPHKGAGLQQNILRFFHDHVAALERLGFDDIQMHWQRPNFEACLEIIPLKETTLDYAFARPRTDLASRLKFAAGRVMVQTGLLAHLTPCFSLIARKV